jgi:hypothetical protein
MAKKNRRGVVYPKRYMKMMKKKKWKKIRRLALIKPVIERKYNDAEIQL